MEEKRKRWGKWCLMFAEFKGETDKQFVSNAAGGVMKQSSYGICGFVAATARLLSYDRLEFYVGAAMCSDWQ